MTPRDTWTAFGRWALDDSFAEALRESPESALEAAGYELDPIELKSLLDATARLAEYPPHHWTALGRAIFDREFGERLANSPELAMDEAGYRISWEELEAITDTRAKLARQAPDAWLAAGRALLDETFAAKLLKDPVETLRQADYTLTPDQIEAVVGRTAQLLGTSQREPTLSQEARRWAFDVVKNALENAARTYRLVTWMNKILFGVGVALFAAAAAYGVAARGQPALVLAGLGVLTFATLFLLGPFERSQSALAKLVQVEISFMNYTEQIAMWEEYSTRDAGIGGKEGADAIRRASAELQRRSAETVEMLQRYGDGPRRGIRGQRAPTPTNGALEGRTVEGVPGTSSPI